MLDDLYNLFFAFISILRTFEFKDFLDIVLVAFVIYSAIKLVRETRAEQLIKGILILLCLYLLSSFINLSMMTALLRTLFEFGVLAIIVLFQPEIRKALEQIGRSKIITKYMKPTGDKDYEALDGDLSKTINAVVDAVTIFQRSKTGALIVFERQTKLGDIINTGTILNASASTAIFGNLFYNKAPLHDGAVIIRNASVYAAGCILPLSKNESIDSNLGTRHRAGIGISEESDAVVVIVSEETGNISTAINGRLERNHSRESLTKLLENELLPEKGDAAERSILSIIKKGDKKHES